jgi:hypothetical protein
MPAPKTNELTDLIKKLRTIRRQHEVALDEIEKTFKSFGIEHLLESKSKPGPKPKGKPGPKPKGKPGPKPGSKRRGRKAKAAATAKGKPGPKPKGTATKAGRKGRGKAKAGKKTRTRQSYAQTGDEFIIAFVAKKGGATTSEIRQHWDKAGRKGKPENNITGLVKSGKLIRNATPGQAGSTYTAPGSTTV